MQEQFMSPFILSEGRKVNSSVYYFHVLKGTGGKAIFRETAMFPYIVMRKILSK